MQYGPSQMLEIGKLFILFILLETGEMFYREGIFFNLFSASSFLGYFCLLNPIQGLESLHHWHQFHFNFVSGISGIWIAVYFLYISPYAYSQHYIGIHWWCSLSLWIYFLLLVCITFFSILVLLAKGRNLLFLLHY